MPNGLLVGALRACVFQIIGVFAGEAGLLGACSGYSDTLLVRAHEAENAAEPVEGLDHRGDE
jgi:hypothetical protein